MSSASPDSVVKITPTEASPLTGALAAAALAVNSPISYCCTNSLSSGSMFAYFCASPSGVCACTLGELLATTTRSSSTVIAVTDATMTETDFQFPILVKLYNSAFSHSWSDGDSGVCEFR